MGCSEAEEICRRHPNQIPQPGVCPSCLRERLSTIANTNASSSIPTSPVYYYYSSASSPANGRRRHQRVASDVIESIYMAMSGGNGLKKSRSMAYGPRNSGSSDHHQGFSKKKKKSGFWNKLLIRYTLKKV